MFNIAVLASTNGTDLQAIIDEMKAGNMQGIKLKIVLSNKDCYAIERAKNEGYKTKIIKEKNPERDAKFAQILENEDIDLVVLVGYMKILSLEFVKKFKTINVHPSLIPKYCGKDFYGQSVHKAVLKAGEKETGMTIHYVEEGVDTGKIILQKKVQIQPNDTLETLKEKVQQLEKKYYPEVIKKIANNANRM